MYSKKQPLSALKEGDRVEDIFVVKIKKQISPYKNKAGCFFSLVLSDSTGKSIDYRYWGSEDEGAAKRIHDSIKEDSVVFVQGKVELYDGKLQISTNSPGIIKALEDGEYDPKEFIIPAKKNIDEMATELISYVNSIENPEIKSILNSLFVDNQELFNKFKTHPGAIEIHHNWTGGLLQHTLEVVKYSELSKTLFVDMSRDVLIAGAILHDIGKLDEIKATTRIKGTRKGQLKDHIVLGFKIVSDIMDRLNISDDVRDKLLHIILSHHGHNEFGSPRQPMFPEAIAIYYADELSSKLAELTEFAKDSKNATEDDFMYNKRHGRNIFLR